MRPSKLIQIGLTLMLWSALAFGVSPLSPLVLDARAGSAPTIVSPSTARGVVNQSFNYQIILANFAQGTYSAEGMPDGLTLDSKVGAISGVPTEIDTYRVLLTATNADGTTTSTLTLTVEPALPPVFDVATSVTTAILDQPLSYQIVATNKPTAYTVEGLPEGLALDAGTGLLTGTPTAAGLYPLTLTATNVRGTTSGALQLSVVPSIPTVSLVADAPSANPLRGEQGRLSLTRKGGDLSQPLTVSFSVKGSAHNGVDYEMISLTKIFKAGKTVKRIHIVPLAPEGDVMNVTKTIKLTLQSSEAYTVDGSAVGKVKIGFEP